jgi:hypothetical protein
MSGAIADAIRPVSADSHVLEPPNCYDPSLRVPQVA